MNLFNVEFFIEHRRGKQNISRESCATIHFGLPIICTYIFLDNKHACGPWWHVFFNTGNVPIKICPSDWFSTIFQGVFSLIDDCLVRHGSSNVSHPRVFVVFCQAQNLLQTESQVGLWFLNQPFFHYSLPACLCHNDFQSSCTSWKDNKGYDQDQFLLWVFASNSQISAWILETRWLFQ